MSARKQECKKFVFAGISSIRGVGKNRLFALLNVFRILSNDVYYGFFKTLHTECQSPGHSRYT